MVEKANKKHHYILKQSGGGELFKNRKKKKQNNFLRNKKWKTFSSSFFFFYLFLKKAGLAVVDFIADGWFVAELVIRKHPYKYIGVAFMVVPVLVNIVIVGGIISREFNTEKVN